MQAPRHRHATPRILTCRSARTFANTAWRSISVQQPTTDRRQDGPKHQNILNCRTSRTFTNTAGRSDSLQQSSTDSKEDAAVPQTIGDFMLLVKEGTATVEAAKKYLQLSRDRISHLPLEQQKKEAAAARAGRILEWFWAEGSRDTWTQDLDGTFTNLLCWHLYAEGLEEYIWQWLEIELQDLPSDKSIPWTDHLFASYVVARLNWNPDCADLAVEALLQGKSRWPIYAGIPCFILRMRLCRDPAPSCSDLLYDRLIDTDLDTLESRRRLKTQALLHLHHPKRPSADELLRLYRRRIKNNDTPPWQGRPADHDRHLLRASYILRLQGKEEDARWLTEKLMKTGEGGIEFRRKVEQDLEREPKIEGLRQQHSLRLQRDAAPHRDL